MRSHDRRLKRVARDALAHHVPGILRIMSRRGRLITDSYQARIFIRDITVYHRFLKTEELVFDVLKISYLGYLLTGQSGGSSFLGKRERKKNLTDLND